MTQVMLDKKELAKMLELAKERLEDWHLAVEEEDEEFGTVIGGCVILEGGCDNLEDLVGEIAFRLNYEQFKRELDYDMYGSHVIKYQDKFYFVEEQ